MYVIYVEDDNYWEVPDDIDSIGFDYSWRPDPYDPPYIHQFGTQWQKTGGPRFVVQEHDGVKYQSCQRVKKLPDPNNRNWRPLIANATIDYSWHPDDTEPPFIYVFGNQWYDSNVMPTYQYRVKGATEKKYITTFAATLLPNKENYKELLAVTDFDYSWRPDPNDPPYNYIFGNEYHTTEFMPTVSLNVPNATETKYVNEVKAKLSIEKVCFEDSIFDAVMEHNFTTKYVHFQNTNHTLDYAMAIPKYNPECEYVHLYEDCAIVPDTIKSHLVEKLTDYPYVITDKLMGYRKPLDIIFFSNGETCAEDNYNHLLSLNLPNRIVRVDKVNGRIASQYAAANSSETPWYFLVNAKLKVNSDFDFSWQPNVMQSRRHYIFKAKNPINGLVYGHMAMVANNKKLTLATTGQGLDFTMDSKTEVVDMLSGTAVFNSEWDVWRTAFRECIKLRNAKDKESAKRLSAWINNAEGPFAQASVKGAKDAIDYFNEVGGDMAKLKLSYDWAWLSERYNK